MNSKEAELNDRFRAWVGTATMTVASGIAVLIMCDRRRVQFIKLPAVWNSTRSWHLVICGVLFLIAAVLLKSRTSSKGSRDGRPLFRQCRLLTRKDCGLCDQAMNTLLQFQDALPSIEVVDIDTDPQLVRQFGESVPVVELDGRVRFRGAVHPALLARLVDAAELRDQRAEAPGGRAAAEDSGVFADYSS